jgi:3-hydroxyacyl-CoA dehydrogenase/enoyl-CoA hydratase/3-hydroxybutyryl-CoA epimerase
MSAFENSVVRIGLDDRIATLTLAMEGGMNKVNADLLEGLAAGLDWLDAQDVAGIVLTSGHADFCAGADLEMLLSTDDPATMLEACTRLNALTDRLETGPPVVAALNGRALGGGYELALACHHRIAVEGTQVGLPEVMLGVIPGGGGTQRLPRLIGIQPALDVILQGKVVRAEKAVKTGMVDQVVPAGDLLEAARSWLGENPRAKQPWRDRKFRWKGIRPGSADARNVFLGASAMVYKKTAGAYEAPKVALAVIADGAAVAFERSLEIEARAFAKLATSPSAKAMIRTLFFHKTAADKHRGLPSTDEHGIQRVAVLGAGMMGAGLAFVCAKAGFEVVLRDVSDDALAAGLAHVDAQVAKLRHRSDDDKAALRGRITGTTDLEGLRGVDLVIEAVPEDLALKHRVIREVEPLLAEGAIFASNTSALPITDLAEASHHPDRFIGLHFFSPVEKMPLLEIIVGAKTDDRTLARCLGVAKAIRKTPIVVNDGYGFYTTRVFSAYILEGAQLVAEGVDPVLVDWAARTAGMAVGPLQVFDEVTLTLGVHAMAEAEKYLGVASIAGADLVRRMVDAGRLGKAHGAGFYDYADGKRRGMWSGIARLVEPAADQPSVEDVAERLILAQVAEVGRTLDDGIVRQFRDADVGAVFGLGFAPNTGGPLGYVDTRGAATVVADLERLAADHGARFAPAKAFRERAASGVRFADG